MPKKLIHRVKGVSLEQPPPLHVYIATSASTFSSNASLMYAFNVRPAFRARMAIWR